jgi:ParB/RepB/Spo0J family partition protein
MSPTPTKSKAKARRVSAETIDLTDQTKTAADGLDWPADYKADIAAQLADAKPEAVQTVVAIPREKLHRHKDNRSIPPESVAELVASMTEHGQREPLRVRPLSDPIGHYEILSGERRFVAAGQIPGIETLRCIVETHSTSQAMIELAVANAARVDLNPIERGELLEKLIAPESEGGAGMDKAAAGRLFGLNAESSVKNALRLVKLPKWIRELLAAGKITVGKARPLCAYPDEVLNAFVDWLHDKQKRWKLENFLSPFDEDDADAEIDSFIRENTRPVDDQATFYKYQFGGDVRCLIELNEASRKLLQVVEIPNNVAKHQTPKGVKRTPMRLVALNFKEWDKQQDALLKKQQVAKAQKGAAKDAAGKPTSKAPTAAELKARRKKADDQLATYTRDWVCLALRYQMTLIAESATMPLLPSLLAKLYDRNLQAFNEWAICELIEKSNRTRKNTAIDLAATIKGDVAEFYAMLWRVILWPSSKWTEGHDDMAPPGTIPERLPALGTMQCHELAEAAGVSMETVWAAAAKDSMQRSLVRRWLLRHNKEQLTALGKSLGVAIADGKREEMAEALLKEHQKTPQKKPLKLPALLAAAGKKGGR